jgi:hypothetical protein
MAAVSVCRCEVEAWLVPAGRSSPMIRAGRGGLIRD